MLQTGYVLKGRYCISALIGKGGSGCLYLARDLELGVVWAVKELPRSHSREAQVLKRLQHPFIPRMIDYVEMEENVYLVMEYIRGKTLGQMKKEGSGLGLKNLRQYALHILDILSYLHGGSPPVVHGDIKPDNLILTEEGKLYLLDMGSAVAGYRRIGIACEGTPGYASPEQYKGMIDERSDFYALGKTLIYLYKGSSASLLLRDIRFWRFLKNCTREDPSRRFSSVSDALAFLGDKNKTENHKKKLIKYAAAAALTAALAFVSSGLLKGRTESSQSFESALAPASECLCSDRMEEGMDMLQSMLSQYTSAGEQRRLLIMLAACAEYLDRPEDAELYYRQLLFYQKDCAEGYGNYGNFLWRMRRYEDSYDLYHTYMENISLEEAENSTDQAENIYECSHNIIVWEGRMKEYEEKYRGHLA